MTFDRLIEILYGILHMSMARRKHRKDSKL